MIGAVLAGLAALAAPLADAANPFLSMSRPPAVEKGIAAMPVIANPANGAERAINTAVARLDRSVARWAADCRKQASGPAAADADWSRTVRVTMAGPRFLSYVILDDAFCGGAHPSSATMALVYDLKSGRPVDWKILLPTSLTGTVALQTGMDGTRTVSLASRRLQQLFVKGYSMTAMGKDSECREAVSMNGELPPSSVWPDAMGDGLAIQFDLAHVAQACAVPVIVAAATLRSEGASAVLVNAIEAAHRHHDRSAK